MKYRICLTFITRTLSVTDFLLPIDNYHIGTQKIAQYSSTRLLNEQFQVKNLSQRRRRPTATVEMHVDASAVNLSTLCGVQPNNHELPTDTDGLTRLNPPAHQNFIILMSTHELTL